MMGKKFLFYLFLMALVIIPFSAKADVSSNITLSCDKKELAIGDSTTCYISLNSSDKLSQWSGKIDFGKIVATGEGESSCQNITISNVKSLNKNYSAYVKDNSIYLNVVDVKPKTWGVYETFASPTDRAADTYITRDQMRSKLQQAGLYNSNYYYYDYYWYQQTWYDMASETYYDKNGVEKQNVVKYSYIDTNENIQKINGKVIQFKITANKNASVGNSSITVTSKQNCDNFYKGDIDADGYLSFYDAAVINACAVGKTSYGSDDPYYKIGACDYSKEQQILRADMDNNAQISTSSNETYYGTTVNAKDSLAVLKILNGKDPVKYVCYNVSNVATSSENGNISTFNLRIIEEVKVPATGAALSILLSILSIGLIVIGIMYITKIKKEQTQE